MYRPHGMSMSILNMLGREAASGRREVVDEHAYTDQPQTAAADPAPVERVQPAPQERALGFLTPSAEVPI